MSLARVLVVDDEADFRGTVRRGLEREGYAVDEAAEGAEALARLRSAPYDLVLLDLYMPGLSGLGLLEALRGGDRTSPPAIIIVTGLGDWGSYARALELGARAFLSKPVGMADLAREVARALGVRQAGAAGGGLARRAER